MLIPVLYLSLSIRDPNHVDDNVYNNHKHPAYAYRKFWLFQEPNRHSPNFFRTACNNHPMNYWTYYILHINAFDNLIAPLRPDRVGRPDGAAGVCRKAGGEAGPRAGHSAGGQYRCGGEQIRLYTRRNHADSGKNGRISPLPSQRTDGHPAGERTRRR